MGEFNSNEHHIHYCGQKCRRRNGVNESQLKSLKCSFGCSLKNDRMILVCFQGKPLSITVIQAYAPTAKAKKAEVDHFHEALQHLQLTPKKDVLLIIEDWNAKVGSQEISGVAGKYGLRVRNEAE